MDPSTQQIIGMGVALLAGKVGKMVGEYYERGTMKPWQKVAAPVAVAAMSFGYSALMNTDAPPDQLFQISGQLAGSAIVTHTLAKNLFQFIKKVVK